MHSGIWFIRSWIQINSCRCTSTRYTHRAHARRYAHVCSNLHAHNKEHVQKGARRSHTHAQTPTVLIATNSWSICFRPCIPWPLQRYMHMHRCVCMTCMCSCLPVHVCINTHIQICMHFIDWHNQMCVLIFAYLYGWRVHDKCVQMYPFKCVHARARARAHTSAYVHF